MSICNTSHCYVQCRTLPRTSKPRQKIQLSSVKIQLPTPNPQPLPHHLQPHNEKESKHANRRLNPKALLRPHSIRPRHPKITHDKPARRHCEIDPRRNFPAAFRITVQIIGVGRDSSDHDAEDVQAPCYGGDHVVVCVFKMESEEDEAGHMKGVEMYIARRRTLGSKWPECLRM